MPFITDKDLAELVSAANNNTHPQQKAKAQKKKKPQQRKDPSVEALKRVIAFCLLAWIGISIYEIVKPYLP